MIRFPSRAVVATVLLLFVGASRSPGSDWPGWRGPHQSGSSDETGLVSSWSPDGENLVWRADFTGRSTPVVIGQRACATGRVGDGTSKQETVACFDAGTGKKLWEHRFKIFHTTVPFTRVGWANPAADPETGALYVHTVSGELVAFDPGGKILWWHSLTEEFGRISGYGGRTHSPIVDEDKVILSFSHVGWGEQARPMHRYFAFDKRRGDVLWVSTPGAPPASMTTYSTPVVAEIGGRRLLIAGNGDGAVHAMLVRTGEPVWKFQLSKQGLDTSVAVDGDRVFATSGDEPPDEARMGRVVAIDGTGTGDVTGTHEIWRAPIKAGYASPLYHGGRLYVVDDSANMHALDAATGAVLWQESLGTVGKGSPVWGDGKIFATEVNGTFAILRPGPDGAAVLDRDHLTMPDGRYAEVYGSPAIAHGRVYFTTEEGFYCLGDPRAPFRPAEPRAAPVPQPGPGEAATLLLVPTEVMAPTGGTVRFEVRAFDHLGNPVVPPAGAAWSLEGIHGRLDDRGTLVLEASDAAAAGKVIVKAGGLTGVARLRAFPPLPWAEDFESVATGKRPGPWVGAGNKFEVQEIDGGRTLWKPFQDRGLERQLVFLGPPGMTGYTIQADLRGARKGRRMPDMGLVANRYVLDLMGNHQRLQLRDWAELRFEKTLDYPWEADVWYTMKLRVDVDGGTALIHGKVWKRGEPEPEEWTLTAEDSLGSPLGSPGLYGYSPTDIHYDNIQVTVNQ